MYGIVMKEYETNGEYSYVVVGPDRKFTTYHGETAYQDATRQFYDHVLPIIYRSNDEN